MIRIKGARQNNLKNISIDLPLYKVIAVTGVSGSGKSSFAFDTLYAEGQRRYIETFSPYVRQFMERLDAPNVESIENIPPAIAIDRKFPVRTSRSTVGTMSEITDYVKLLFPRIAKLFCEKCGREVKRDTPAQIWNEVKREVGKRLIICFPLEGLNKEKRKELISLGFTRVYENGNILELNENFTSKKAYIVVDRTKIVPEKRERIVDSLEQAFRFGNGKADLFLEEKHLSFSNRLECSYCKIKYRDPFPNLFSFNNPVGACDECKGFGKIIDIDLDLIIPDKNKSLIQGAIKPWGDFKQGREEFFDLMEFCKRHNIPTNVPFKELSEEQKEKIINGTRDFYGIRGFFEWLETKKYKMHVRVYLSRYRGYVVCPKCNGTRFKKEALLYRINELNIAQIYALSIDKAKRFFEEIKVSPFDKASQLILSEIRSRLSYLQEVGLGYLTLDRQSRTLSSGELQRLSLTSALGANLVDSLYILDEPSVGLHPRDTSRLTSILKKLRNQRNTVIVVEHDPELIKNSDIVLDLGPGAGDKGGKLVYFGPPEDMKEGLTAEYLTGKRKIPIPKSRRTPVGYIHIKKASEHNLKKIDVRIPLGVFVCITGVSGSGKSTLAEDVLYKGIKWLKGNHQERPGKFEEITGIAQISDVVLVDQSPIGRTPRGNILTYTKAMDPIRRILAQTSSAKEKGLTPSHFSFNVPGGRCETCKGEGYEKVEMQFLSDVFIKCPDCNGLRYKKEILEVEYKGKNIADIFSMTVDSAIQFFKDVPEVVELLKIVSDVGLGYLRLGQPINTLSGGEGQRLKLSRYLKEKGKNILFILDEPTTGLHFEDINKLLKVLNRIVDAGNSLVVIEHNLDVIKSADWVIDLGPEGGEQGGTVVAEGRPEQIIKAKDSYTGRFLKKSLENFYKKEQKREKEEALSPPFIFVKGAREHNLKNIELSIPRQKLVIVTGVSGSGKSTLVYDVLFSEGQRRYLECLAPYVRQYIKIIERADVDFISGLPPTVAIEQRISQAGKRSTVGTITEIYHFLRLLYSNLGKRHCPVCGKALEVVSEESIVKKIIETYKGKEALLLVPKAMRRKGAYKELLSKAYKRGIRKARIDGIFLEIKPDMMLERYREHNIELVLGEVPDKGVEEFISNAIKEGNGTVILLDRDGKEQIFSTKGICPECGTGFRELDPLLFSFNSKYGACKLCDGLGRLNGKVCPECNGSRLNKEALSVTLYDYSIWDMTRITSEQLYALLKEIPFSDRELKVAEPILREIFSRLNFMKQLGISYLTLDRSADTLSGGEAQRVRFSAQLGSNLTGACYILDEPTIGLHPRDNKRLIEALKRLRDKGNSLIVVEHDSDMIKNADHIIDMGPGPGIHGGRIVAQGNLEEIKKAKDSITGKLIDTKAKLTSKLRPYKNKPFLKVVGAYEHNLKQIDAEFPLGTFICVTGVSGSGKSTLVKDVLLEGLKQKLGKQRLTVKCKDIIGWNYIDKVLEVDHKPIGNTPRSIPASYIGILSYIRELFASVPDSRARGYGPGRFSFNVKGGRCETCRGFGYIKVSMSFLPDVYIKCEVCNGTRFNADTLQINYKGKNIAQVLDMTFEEAMQFFSSIPQLKKRISLVCDVGLGYLRLGQPSPTLSGGEAQRIKLVKELSKSSNEHTLYVLDEPTTGLHIADIKKLLETLQRIVEKGNTVIVIEHNLEVIKEADYIIDLGPEGGEKGGSIVATGSPAEFLKLKNSYTADALREYLLAGK